MTKSVTYTCDGCGGELYYPQESNTFEVITPTSEWVDKAVVHMHICDSCLENNHTFCDYQFLIGESGEVEYVITDVDVMDLGEPNVLCDVERLLIETASQFSDQLETISNDLNYRIEGTVLE